MTYDHLSSHQSKHTHSPASLFFKANILARVAPAVFKSNGYITLPETLFLSRVAGNAVSMGSFTKQEHLFDAFKKLRDIYSCGARELRSLIRANLT